MICEISDRIRPYVIPGTGHHPDLTAPNSSVEIHYDGQHYSSRSTPRHLLFVGDTNAHAMVGQYDRSTSKQLSFFCIRACFFVIRIFLQERLVCSTAQRRQQSIDLLPSVRDACLLVLQMALAWGCASTTAAARLLAAAGRGFAGGTERGAVARSLAAARYGMHFVCCFSPISFANRKPPRGPVASYV